MKPLINNPTTTQPIRSGEDLGVCFCLEAMCSMGWSVQD
jgi:hypothetical protein